MKCTLRISPNKSVNKKYLDYWYAKYYHVGNKLALKSTYLFTKIKLKNYKLYLALKKK